MKGAAGGRTRKGSGEGALERAAQRGCGVAVCGDTQTRLGATLCSG